MWIHLVSLIISLLSVNVILPILIPRFKEREKIENVMAETNKIAFPDKSLKVFYVFLTFFCLVVGLILLFVPQLCGFIGFNWLIANIVWWSIVLIDLIFILFAFQVSYIEYNDDYILITNIFRKIKKINYCEIIKIDSNIKIFTRREKYSIPCSFFYGGKAFKSFILEKLNGVG